MRDNGELSDLDSIGPAMLRDFERLGIRSVAELARRNPEKLYERLCAVTGRAQDICVLDVFRCAVAQARARVRGTRLPAAQRQWWYWSRQRRKAQTRNQR
jgi:nucleotidyltransferase/DNA polymerase involved in DNA repair